MATNRASGPRALKPRNDIVTISKFCSAKMIASAAISMMTAREIRRMGVSSSSITKPAGEQTANYTSTPAVQAEAESDPACAGHHEIDAKEQAEDIEARDRPMGQNEQAEQQRDHTGQHYPDPGRFLLHAEGQNDPHDAGGHQRCAENEREQCGGEQGILERHESGDDVERPEQDPE